MDKILDMKRLFIVLLAVFAFACGPEKSLQKKYVGENVSAMEMEFGKPTAVFNNGNSYTYMFEKVTDLKSTEISQHKITLDPMVSPEVIKTQNCTVTVVDGIIKKIVLDEEYERKTQKKE